MKTTAQLKALSKGKNKKYMHIYYQSKGNIIRVNTGYEYQPSYTKADGLYNTSKKNYRVLNSDMLFRLRKANEYIQYCLTHGITMDSKECKKYLYSNMISPKELSTPNSPNLNSKFREDIRVYALDWFDDFYSYKKAELQNKWSLKDYKSLWNVLLDFERDNGRFTFADMNSKEWLFRFRDYLSQPRPKDTKTKKYGYLSDGNLTDTTINKRFQTLKNWFKWVEQTKKIHVFEKEVMGYNVKKIRQEIITLSFDELKELYYFKEYDDKERHVIDLFILNCLMGLRYGDLSSLQKQFFETNEKGEMYYVKYNQKTKEEINVPINETAREILEKYNFQPTVYANAYLNKRIKEILKKHKLLETPVKKNEKRSGEIKMIPMLKREAITTHTARKTYVTNCFLLGIPPNVIMSSTGHRLLSTVNLYAEKVKDFKAFKGMKL